MSKIEDGILGFIVGDALGVPVEFNSRYILEKRPVVDMIGYGTYNVPVGTWSDDTSMSIATIDSINEKGYVDYNDICDKFVSWVYKNNYNAIDRLFDIGGTCSRAIEKYMFTGDVFSGSINNDHVGNGSLMRIAPIAYYLYCNNITDEKEIIKLCSDVSSFTHAQDDAKLGCYIYVRYMMYLLDGLNKNEAYSLIKQLDYSMFDSQSIMNYSRILKFDINKYQLHQISSKGEVVDTLESVLWMFLNTDNYKSCVLGCVNLGNDTDTIAAIAGALAGIVYGKDEIPEHWINNLAKKEYLFDLISEFEKKLNYENKKELK